MAEQRERVIILIDGSNFYNRMKECGVKRHRMTEFSYIKLADWLAGGRKIVARNYYIGAIKAEAGNSKGQQLRRKQQQLFAHLRSKQQKFNIILGANRKQGASYHEKGVDVRMAVDITAGAYKETYDTAIIVSSDSDLIPAIVHARKQKRKVEYVGFRHKPTSDIKKNSNKTVFLTRADIEQFIS